MRYQYHLGKRVLQSFLVLFRGSFHKLLHMLANLLESSNWFCIMNGIVHRSFAFLPHDAVLQTLLFGQTVLEEVFRTQVTNWWDNDYVRGSRTRCPVLFPWRQFLLGAAHIFSTHLYRYSICDRILRLCKRTLHTEATITRVPTDG